MPADPAQTARLRELHGDFVWKMNAAVAEGRADLVHRLSAEYLEQALGIVVGEPPPAAADGCGAGGPPAAPPRRRRRWRGLLGAPGALGRPPRA